MPRENHQKEDLFPPAMLSDAACECEVPKRGRRHIKPGVYACLNCGRIIPKPPRRRPPPPPSGNGEGAIAEEENKIGADTDNGFNSSIMRPSNDIRQLRSEVIIGEVGVSVYKQLIIVD